MHHENLVDFSRDFPIHLLTARPPAELPCQAQAHHNAHGERLKTAPASNIKAPAGYGPTTSFLLRGACHEQTHMPMATPIGASTSPVLSASVASRLTSMALVFTALLLLTLVHMHGTRMPTWKLRIFLHPRMRVQYDY